MQHIFFYLLVGFFFFSSCREEKKGNVRQIPKKTESKKKLTNKVVHPTHFIPKAEPKPKFIPPTPCPIDPEPYPIDPEPYPIDPPGYIPEPIINCIGPPEPLPKTIRDSIVNFPDFQASFGGSYQELDQYIVQKMTTWEEWKFLYDLGLSGKIYMRLLIDTKGKVREVTFLKFTDKQLEILKPRLSSALLGMPNWIPAKDQNGQNVVSEYTLPVRIEFY